MRSCLAQHHLRRAGVDMVEWLSNQAPTDQRQRDDVKQRHPLRRHERDQRQRPAPSRPEITARWSQAGSASPQHLEHARRARALLGTGIERTPAASPSGFRMAGLASQRTSSSGALGFSSIDGGQRQRGDGCGQRPAQPRDFGPPIDRAHGKHRRQPAKADGDQQPAYRVQPGDDLFAAAARSAADRPAPATPPPCPRVIVCSAVQPDPPSARAK